MVGACGGVGCTTALGLAALREGLTDATGLVSELPVFASAGLPDPKSVIIGGHEIRRETLLEAVQGLHRRAGVFSSELIRSCAPRLRAMQRDIRPGTLCAAGKTIHAMVDRPDIPRDRRPIDAVNRLADDIAAFRTRRKLDRVVVVHLASSEPPYKTGDRESKAGKRRSGADERSLQRALSRPGSTRIPASALYALAAFEAGCSYINFTPSPALRLPAVLQRADSLGLPCMGSDGKTGETLVKSVLAPMFAMRHLKVLTWFGQNILGNRDGEVLKDPRTRASKVASKDKTLSRLLGGAPTTRVSIDYLPSLDDWKVAWDFVHFEGFLGTKMSMQFVWQGCDSLLAAPLVIDLARFAAREHRLGQFGPMKHLAFFFKDPLEAGEFDLFSQWRRLVEHVVPDQPCG